MNAIVYFPNGTKATYTIGTNGVSDIQTSGDGAKLVITNSDPSLTVCYYNMPHSLASSDIVREIDPTS